MKKNKIKQRDNKTKWQVLTEGEVRLSVELITNKLEEKHFAMKCGMFFYQNS